MNLGTMRHALSSALGERFYYGWTMAAVAALGAFASGPGQSQTFSVFVGSISDDLGLSRTTIASAYGGATLATAFLLPSLGGMVDRHGARRAMLWVAVLLGLAAVLFAATAGIATLAIGFWALRLLGQGAMMMTSANLIGHWFNRRRGAAAGLMAVGFSASVAFHPPFSLYLIQEIGWRQAWIVLGVMTWVLMLPPVLLLVYDRPQHRGLKPDGSHAATGTGAAPAEADGLTLADALGTPAFYILAAGWFGLVLLLTTLHFHQMTVLTGQGVSAELAAGAFTIAAIIMAAAVPLIGRSFDRFRTRHVLASGFLVTSLSLLTMTFARDVWTVLVYAASFGLCNAFVLTTFGFMMPRYFGRRHLGRLQGAVQTVGVIGASLGPLPVGLALDYLGSPTSTLRLLALYPLVCAAAALLFLRTPRGVCAAPHLE